MNMWYIKHAFNFSVNGHEARFSSFYFLFLCVPEELKINGVRAECYLMRKSSLTRQGNLNF